MTDIDSFAEWFDESSREAHKRASRTDQPSARVWQDVSAQVAPPGRSLDASPPISDLDQIASCNERTHTMNSTLTFPTSKPTPAPSRSVSAWIAAAVVLMLVASGFYLNTLRPGGGEQHLAWAPATPESTPVSDYACDVTPLTTDEVMATVMNPANGYVRLGMTEYANSAGSFWESRNTDLNTETVKVGYIRNGNSAALKDAATAANMYSNCVQNGTLLQVWALMDPWIVQADVLSRFPVLRTEEQLRAFVEEWGPQPFPGDGHGIIGRFLGQAKHNGANDWLGSTMINGSQNDLAIISIYDENPAEGRAPIRTEVSLQLYPGGQWMVTGLHSPNSRG